MMGNYYKKEEKSVRRGERPFAPTTASVGQVTMEYAIIFSVVLAAIFATGIIDKTRDSFKIYLAKANDSMTVIRKGAEAQAGGREGAGGGEVAVGLETPGAADQPAQPQEGPQEQEDPMAAVVKMNSEAKTELAGLEADYAAKKEKYDRIRAIPVIGWFMPEFAETDDAKLMQVKIDAYRTVTDATTPLVEGNE